MSSPSTYCKRAHQASSLTAWLLGIEQNCEIAFLAEADSVHRCVSLSTDSKLDSKSNLHIINELAELNNCNVSRGVFGGDDHFISRPR